MKFLWQYFFFSHEIQPVSHSSLSGIPWFQWVQFWLVLLGCCGIMWVGWPVSVEGSMNCRLRPRHKWFLFRENSGCQVGSLHPYSEPSIKLQLFGLNLFKYICAQILESPYCILSLFFLNLITYSILFQI